MSNKGNVLFIVHDVYQDDNTFPLGIGYLSAVLREYGAKVTVCCQDVFHYTDEELINKFLKGKKYDLIGVGFLSARFKETIIGLSKTINKHKGNAKFVLGGHGASALPEYTLKTTKADIVSIGESEETIIELLDTILNNASISNIKGIAYRINDKVYVNERRKRIQSLDDLPFPAWDLFPMHIYTTNIKVVGMSDNDKSFHIITSRGCTNNCRFCYRIEKGIRFRKISSVIKEMKTLYDTYGVTYFIIQDELFISSIGRLKRFVQGLKDSNLLGKIKYDVNVGIRADIATDELAKILKESGCVYVNIGFESVDQQCLDEYNKNTTVEDNFKSAELMSKYDIRLGINFIFGIMSDTKETLQKSVDFIKKYNTYGELRTIRPITPYPGCDLYQYAIDNGLLSGASDFFDKFRNSDLMTVNFSSIPDDDFYQMLFEANKELILNHYQNTNQNMKEAYEMIDDFHKLYFEGFDKFRGARHFNKEDI